MPLTLSHTAATESRDGGFFVKKFYICQYKMLKENCECQQYLGME